MPLPTRPLRVLSVPLILVLVVLWASAITMAQSAPAAPNPLLSESAMTRVSEHVYAIVGYPNIGMVVGSRGTLVIDTGLGARNGAIIVRVAQKLAKGPNLYLTTTHYHSEHTTGEQAFPANTVLIRAVVQQEEMNKGLAAHMDRFRSMSALNKELLQDVKMRPPDILFDREMKLDLGGVTARLFWLGAAHTKGDELIFVEEDSVLFPGDIVENKLFPMMPNDDASAKGWLSIVDQLEPLNPRFIVPDHGQLGDGSLIGKQRSILAELQGRALELKRQGTSVEDAGRLLTTEFLAKYPDWGNTGVIPNVVKRVYAESQ
jgi:glyoxylase-like metal-dependent hydrolase (beta-lactamase superfamily II)